ncbi:hypothetical protein PR048_030783 [Dryococelus australis]|uniref:Doublecortin domain-containing protein n=1 Tax=Dryococelus australis TaxID=614101 RepID=A0ABQ9G9Y7_9NEOP|nr:hypothetical protein PR048_030783 [Dryococelus australis]
MACDTSVFNGDNAGVWFILWSRLPWHRGDELGAIWLQSCCVVATHVRISYDLRPGSGLYASWFCPSTCLRQEMSVVCLLQMKHCTVHSAQLIKVNMEQRRNEGANYTGYPRENPLTSGIVRHDSHLRFMDSFKALTQLETLRLLSDMFLMELDSGTAKEKACRGKARKRLSGRNSEMQTRGNSRHIRIANATVLMKLQARLSSLDYTRSIKLIFSTPGRPNFLRETEAIIRQLPDETFGGFSVYAVHGKVVRDVEDTAKYDEYCFIDTATNTQQLSWTTGTNLRNDSLTTLHYTARHAGSWLIKPPNVARRKPHVFLAKWPRPHVSPRRGGITGTGHRLPGSHVRSFVTSTRQPAQRWHYWHGTSAAWFTRTFTRNVHTSARGEVALLARDIGCLVHTYVRSPVTPTRKPAQRWHYWHGTSAAWFTRGITGTEHRLPGSHVRSFTRNVHTSARGEVALLARDIGCLVHTYVRSPVTSTRQPAESPAERCALLARDNRLPGSHVRSFTRNVHTSARAEVALLARDIGCLVHTYVRSPVTSTRQPAQRWHYWHGTSAAWFTRTFTRNVHTSARGEVALLARDIGCLVHTYVHPQENPLLNYSFLVEAAKQQDKGQNVISKHIHEKKTTLPARGSRFFHLLEGFQDAPYVIVFPADIPHQQQCIVARGVPVFLYHVLVAPSSVQLLPMTFQGTSEEIWAALNSARMKEQEKRDIPDKTRRPVASSSTIPTCENPSVSRPGIQSSSPRLTAQPPIRNYFPSIVTNFTVHMSLSAPVKIYAVHCIRTPIFSTFTVHMAGILKPFRLAVNAYTDNQVRTAMAADGAWCRTFNNWHVSSLFACGFHYTTTQPALERHRHLQHGVACGKSRRSNIPLHATHDSQYFRKPAPTWLASQSTTSQDELAASVFGATSLVLDQGPRDTKYPRPQTQPEESAFAVAIWLECGNRDKYSKARNITRRVEGSAWSTVEHSGLVDCGLNVGLMTHGGNSGCRACDTCQPHLIPDALRPPGTEHSHSMSRVQSDRTAVTLHPSKMRLEVEGEGNQRATGTERKVEARAHQLAAEHRRRWATEGESPNNSAHLPPQTPGNLIKKFLNAHHGDDEGVAERWVEFTYFNFSAGATGKRFAVMLSRRERYNVKTVDTPCTRTTRDTERPFNYTSRTNRPRVYSYIRAIGNMQNLISYNSRNSLVNPPPPLGYGRRAYLLTKTISPLLRWCILSHRRNPQLLLHQQSLIEGEAASWQDSTRMTNEQHHEANGTSVPQDGRRRTKPNAARSTRCGKSEARRVWGSGGSQGRGKRKIPEKTRRPATLSGAIPTCEDGKLSYPATMKSTSAKNSDVFSMQSLRLPGRRNTRQASPQTRIKASPSMQELYTTAGTANQKHEPCRKAELHADIICTRKKQTSSIISRRPPFIGVSLRRFNIAFTVNIGRMRSRQTVYFIFSLWNNHVFYPPPVRRAESSFTVHLFQEYVSPDATEIKRGAEQFKRGGGGRGRRHCVHAQNRMKVKDNERTTHDVCFGKDEDSVSPAYTFTLRLASANRSQIGAPPPTTSRTCSLVRPLRQRAHVITRHWLRLSETKRLQENHFNNST